MRHYFAILSLVRLIKSGKEVLIVNGDVGEIWQYPHSAMLDVVCHKIYHPGWICGASIVNQKILLTAAHCVIACPGENTMSISVGHRHLKKGAVSSVHSVYPHKRHHIDNFNCDIALIRLKTDLNFSSKVQRVALMKQPPYYEKAHIAGWGLVQENPEQLSKLLHYIDQYVWKKDKCLKVNEDLDSGTFCASSKKKDSVPSGGDSGSALIVRGYIQIGIVSYKMPTVSRTMVIYTNTGYYFKWIRRNANKLNCVNTKS